MVGRVNHHLPCSVKTLFFLLISTALPGGPASAQPAGSCPVSPAEKEVNLSKELTLRYVEQGAESGTPVVFLHGYSDSWHSYELVLPHLPPSVHAYVPSQRGHGNSSRPTAGYHPDDFADDVAAFMDRLRIRQAVIVGHSLGGSVAQSFAVRHPKRVKALVLVASFANYDKAAIHEMNKVVSGFSDPVDKNFAAEFQRSTIHRPVPNAFFATAVSESQKLPARVWRDVMAGMLTADYTEKLESVRIPTLLIGGDQDQLATEADQQRLQAVLADSKRIIYEGTGHAVHWEEPGRFANDLVQFLNTVQ